MKKNSLILASLLLFITASGYPSSADKVVIIGTFIRSDSCKDFIRKLPPGVTLNMKDPCGIECRWFDVKNRDNIFYPEIKPDSLGNFKLELPVTGLSQFTIFSVYHGKILMVSPGDTVRIRLNDTDAVNPLVVTPGYDTSQVLFFRQNSRWNCYNGFDRWRKPMNDTLLTRMNQYIDSCITPFRELRSKNLCSEEFFDFVATDIRYYAAYQVSQTLWSDYVNDSLSKGEKEEALKILGKIYLEFPLRCDNYVTPSGTGFDDYILTWIWLENLKSGKSINKYKDNPGNLQANLEMAKRQLTRKAYELFALERIRIHALRFDTIAFDLFEKLNREFPVTGFPEQHESTEKAINTLKEFMKSAHSPDKKEIIFIPDGIKIKSLEELISKFPGQQLYVDMWATWCGPCVMYFQYNEKIRPFLREHGITEIFITLDKDTVKWKTAVKYYDLQGVNMVAGGELLKDLRQKLDWDGGVPQFFIISRNGRVAVKDARTPVAEEELFKQLLDNR